MAPDPSQQWLATCPRGVTAVLHQELQNLGARDLKEQGDALYFHGTRAVMYRACLWSRVASRILMPLGGGPADSADVLYATLVNLPWESWLQEGASIAVDFFGSNEQIRNTRFGAQRSKDAIVDRCRSAGGAIPEVDLKSPDLRIQVRLSGKRVDAALDMVGESLHRRGYRQAAGAAPMKESLAAAVLLRAGWPALAEQGAALIDPMCGSATLLLEGALMAADRAPALGRSHFAFEYWKGHDAQQWQAVRADAEGRASRALEKGLPEIRGYDGDPRVIRRAQDNIAAAGFSKWVRVSVKALGEVRKPTHKPLPMGLLVTNPPYGERLGDRQSLPVLYRRLGEVMHDHFGDWQAAVLAGDRDLGKALGLRSHRQYELYNGRLPVTLVLLDLRGNRLSDTGVPKQSTDSGSTSGVEAGPSSGDPPSNDGGVAADPVSAEALASAEMFANRLRKNQRKLASWLKKTGYSCYRLYDADIPEYAVAIDRYEDWLHVAEYKAPGGIDEAVAAERLRALMTLLPEAAGVPSERIVLKRRERQSGSSQYAARGHGSSLLSVNEDAARLLVNLHDYLDTGLFLDHRPLRLRIGREARGKRFLNLFCYTGSATIHAALGGAQQSMSVDLSNTYLRWLRKNLAHNGISESRHRTEKADVLKWLRATQEAYDLILLDPPSFSNSKNLPGSFDVQRDHAGLIDLAMARLNEGGLMYFSNNRRRFKLDPAVSERYHVEDISAQTFDRDFPRRPGPHQCWIIRAYTPTETA